MNGRGANKGEPWGSLNVAPLDNALDVDDGSFTQRSRHGKLSGSEFASVRMLEEEGAVRGVGPSDAPEHGTRCTVAEGLGGRISREIDETVWSVLRAPGNDVLHGVSVPNLH